MRELLDWVQDTTGLGRPGWRKVWFLLAGAGLLILRLILSNVSFLRPMAAFAEAALESLGHINVFSFLGAYIEHVRCGTTDLGGELYYSCDMARLINPINYIVSLPQAIFKTLTASGEAVSLLVYLIALMTGLALSNYMWRRYVKNPGRDTHIWDIVAIALGTVIITSVVALAMQISGIVLFWVFGQIVGLLVLLAVDYKIVVSLYKAARKIEKVAKGEYGLRDAASDIADETFSETNPLSIGTKLADSAKSVEKGYDWLKGKFGRPK